jgi:hypothetical protein
VPNDLDTGEHGPALAGVQFDLQFFSPEPVVNAAGGGLRVMQQ